MVKILNFKSKQNILQVGIWLDVEEVFKDSKNNGNKLFWYWIIHFVFIYAAKITFLIKLVQQILVGFLESTKFETQEDIDTVKVKLCEGYSFLAIFASFVFVSMLIKSIYNNILEYGNQNVSAFFKFLLMLEVSYDSILALLFLFYIASFQSISDVLLNLTGLILLIEFSSIICEVFDIFIHRYFPMKYSDDNFLNFKHSP